MGKRYEVRWGATLIGMAENQSRVTSLKRAAKLLGAKPRQVVVIDHGGMDPLTVNQRSTQASQKRADQP